MRCEKCIWNNHKEADKLLNNSVNNYYGEE